MPTSAGLVCPWPQSIPPGYAWTTDGWQCSWADLIRSFSQGGSTLGNWYKGQREGFNGISWDLMVYLHIYIYIHTCIYRYTVIGYITNQKQPDDIWVSACVRRQGLPLGWQQTMGLWGYAAFRPTIFCTRDPIFCFRKSWSVWIFKGVVPTMVKLFLIGCHI
jgi:hypothetical protein